MTSFTELFEYEYYANITCLQVALPLETMPERAEILSSHLLCAQRMWIARIQDVPSPLGVWDRIPPLEWKHWLEANHADLRAILANGNLDRIINYRNTQGKAFRNACSDILLHILIHGAYHRGQIMQLLKPLVNELPSLDYIFFSRDRMDSE